MMVRVSIAVSHRRARLSAAYQVLRGKDSKTGLITPETQNENLKLLEAAQSEVLNQTLARISENFRGSWLSKELADSIE